MLAVLALCGLLASGCSGGSDDSAAPETTAPVLTGPPQETTAPPEEPARLFTKADVRRLALQPSDRPLGMRYVKAESGMRTFFDVGIIGDEPEREADEQDLRAVFDATFDAPRTDMRVAARYWLFAKAAGARYWFDRTRERSQAVGFQELQESGLGDESWAGGGDLGGPLVISHVIRIANVLVVVSQSTSQLRPSEEEALTAARQAVRRLERAA